MLKRRTLRIVEEALRNRDGTLWLIVFMGATAYTALTLGRGAPGSPVCCHGAEARS